MKKLLAVSVLISISALADVYHSPKLKFVEKQCADAPVHSNICEDVTVKAPINCASDADQVCRQLDPHVSGAVKNGLKCKTLDISTLRAVKENVEASGYPVASFLFATFGNSELMFDGAPAVWLPYLTIDSQGEKTLKYEGLLTNFEAKVYEYEPGKREIKIISSIECQ
jgi:hypothetical protein